jgi:hypothetical protein
MRIEKILDRGEIARRDDQIVVEKNQNFAGRLADSAILDSAFARAGIVQMPMRGRRRL